MMLNLWQPLTVSLYNTVVSFEARPLKRGVVCRLMPHMRADATLDDSLAIIDIIADVLPEYVRNISCVSLLELFYDCHTFCFDGGAKPHKTSKNKQIRTGYWLRTVWPDGQCLLEQNNLLVEAFRIIMHEQEQLY